MKITYIHLKNVAGLVVGSGLDDLEIDFKNAKNVITSIMARNASGKSVLISSLTPFAYVTSLDDRSTISYILLHKDGYKEIHYQDNDTQYVIKHYFKANKDTHSVKSYFMKDGVELNENGNVTSFNELVKIHFGLTQEMMRLIRIGTNVNSFITLTPARRKEYVGKLIEEIDLYVTIYKKVTDDIRVVKTMLQTNNTNLYNCHIQDIVVEENTLQEYVKTIRDYEKERDQLIAKKSKLDALMQDNNVDELKRKLNEAQASMNDLVKVEDQIKDRGLENTTLDDLMKKRSEYSNKKIEIQSNINSFRIAIDSIYHNIERLETSVMKLSSDNDINELNNTYKKLKEEVENTNKSIVNFVASADVTSEDVYAMLVKLQSFNQISQMLMAFSDTAINTYLKLRRDNVSVRGWLQEQSKKKMSQLNTEDIRALMRQVFQDEDIITPNCDTEYKDCPFYRFHEVVSDFHSKMEQETFDDETLHNIEIIWSNIERIVGELEYYEKIQIPDRIKNELVEEKMLNRLGKRQTFFDLSDLQEYLGLLRDYEIYKKNYAQMRQYEHQLLMYHKSGVESQMEEIKHQKEQIETYNTSINNLRGDISKIDILLQSVDFDITIVTKYNDGKKYKKVFESTIESTQKILAPLENAANERMELKFSIEQITNLINMSRENHRILENKINEYKRLVKEGEKLSQKNRDLTIIQEAVSTKKGIPVVYMKRYLDKIQKLSNELLKIIYDDEFRLAQFNVTQDTFEVPYIKNGKKIPDVKYASQSELSLATMALSFALANNATGKYNILLLDECDAGLDSANRAAFLKMLYAQMETLHAEQVFIISHNLSEMTNLPMDCIKLSDVSMRSKLQNIIYE